MKTQITRVDSYDGTPTHDSGVFVCHTDDGQPWTCEHDHGRFRVSASSRFYLIARVRCVIQMMRLTWAAYDERRTA